MRNVFEEISVENNSFASKEDFSRFHTNIQQKIEEKSKQLGLNIEDFMGEIGVRKDLDISNEERKIIDWDSLDNIGNPEGRKFSVDELNQIESDIIETINAYPSCEDISEVVDFVNNHKKRIQMSMLLLYISSFGTALLDAFAENDIKVELDGKELGASDLLKSIEISQKESIDVPYDIVRDINIKSLKSEEGAFLRFDIVGQDEDLRVKIVGSGVYDTLSDKDRKGFEELMAMEAFLKQSFEEDRSMSAPGDLGLYSVGLKEFERDRSDIESSIANIMHVPSEEVHEYFNNLIELKNEDNLISLVPLEEINIDSRETKGDFTRFYDTVLEKYNLSDSAEKEKAIQECEQYAKDCNCDNFWHALNKERLDDPFSTLTQREVSSELVFNDVFVKFISQEVSGHYDVNELKKDPDRAYEVVFEFLVDGLNIKDDKLACDQLDKSLQEGFYGNKQKLVNSFIDGDKIDVLPTIIEAKLQESSNKDAESWILKNLDISGFEEDQKNPEEIIKDVSDFVATNFDESKGFSEEDRCEIFMGIKHMLAERGLDGFDKFGVVLTLDQSGQPITEMITIDENGKILVSVIDFSTINDKESIEAKEAHKNIMTKLESLHKSDELLKSLSLYDVKSVGGRTTLAVENDVKQSSLLKRIRTRIEKTGI